MAKALRFLFVVGLPVTTPTAVGGGTGIKTKSKMQCQAINFVIQSNSSMKYLGIDFGTKRIGIAISDNEGTLAFPRAVLENNEEFFDQLREMVQKEGIEKIVVGVPKALSGKETAMTHQVQKFIERLRGKGLNVEEENEIFSTKIAEKDASKNMRDAAAAALILRQYIDRNIERNKNPALRKSGV